MAIKGQLNTGGREVPEEELHDEKAFLDTLYSKGSERAEYIYLDARARFKGD